MSACTTSLLLAAAVIALRASSRSSTWEAPAQSTNRLTSSAVVKGGGECALYPLRISLGRGPPAVCVPGAFSSLSRQAGSSAAATTSKSHISADRREG